MPPDSVGGVWQLVHFKERLPGLGPLSGPEAAALRDWLERLARNPAAVRKRIRPLGTHIGQTADPEEREGPFPPAYRSRIGGDILCDFMVDPDARRITCIGLSRFRS